MIRSFTSLGPLLISLAPLAVPSPALAGEIIVTITGATSDTGEIGCGLYASEDGFPMDAAKAVQQWQAPQNGAVVCRFEGLAAGGYAASASHDLNGNRKTDMNFLGIPKEAWGVSNNIRPNLRAPRFDEAHVELGADDVLPINIELDQ